ncbi:MAG TPA: carboxypeptidase regulatory-like domain-containing protein [Phycisphaerae bacterium]|nr:carboxypeptidase regulatory-like domain-containing protein [Phycisphaerae bacterium]
MTAIENLLSPEVVRIIGWTLVHSLWQGLGVALLLAVTLAWLRRRSANARYVAACAALLLVTGAALLTAGLLSFRSGTGTMASDPVGTSAGVAALPVVPLPATASPAPGGQMPRPVSLGQPAPMGSPPLPARTPWRVRVFTFLEPILPWIVLGWLAGVIVLSMRLLGGWAQAERLKRCGTRFVAEVWRERLRGLADRLRVTRPVRLLESTLAEVPTAIGWLRPVILIPTGALTGLTPDQLEALLAHELAHIRRYDYLLNVLQTVIETLLFYHPGVWWISRRIRTEREHCCDDLAVAVCGDALGYARALAELEERRGVPARVAVAAKGGPLLRRVRRLVGVATPHGNRSVGWLGAAIVIGLVAAAGSGLWLAHATEPGPTPQDSEDKGPQTAALYKPIPAESGPTNTITGIVIDEHDQSVADASVRALLRDGDSRRETRTGADGRFAFENLEPEGFWLFSVDDARFAKQWERETCLQVPYEQLDLPLQLRLHKPRSLNGVVLNEEGERVAGVRVTLAREWLPGCEDPVQGWLAWDLQVTETDGEGRFRLERLRPGRVTLVLDHPGYARTIAHPVDVTDAETRVTIKKGLTLRGRVTHDGEPLAGVSVTINAINLSHRPLGHWQVRTDAGGEFTIEHVVGWSADIVVLGSVTVASVFVDDPEWNSPVYQVSQIDEQTLPFVEIEARPGAADLNTREVKKVGKADPALRAELSELPSGEAEIEVRLEPAPTSGRAPEVCLSRLTQEDKGRLHLGESPGPEGVVAFVKLPAGKYRVRMDNYEPPNYAPQDVAVAEGQHAQVVLHKGPAKLSGVLRCNGERLTLSDRERSAVWCEVPSPDPRIGTGRYTGLLREDGSYEIDGLAYGHYLVTVSLSSSWPHTFAIDIREPETRRDVDLPSACITGKVLVDLPPRPAEAPRGPYMLTVTRRHAWDTASANAWRLDENQAFRIDHVPLGVYRISFTAWIETRGAQPIRLDGVARLSSPGEHVHVELHPKEQQTGWIAGTITLKAPDAARALSERDRVVVGAYPKIDEGYDTRGRGNYVFKAEGMTYRLTDVPAGTYGVLASFRATRAIVWIPDVEVRAGLVRTLDITIPQGREVRILPGYQGEPPSALFHWRLRMPTGDWLPFGSIVGSHGQRVSAPRSSFVLAYGEYVVDAHFGEGRRARQAFTVTPGDGVQEIVVPIP